MLLGILYSEFDNEAGPLAVHQFPDGVLCSETFDSISDYVIVPPRLCGKFTTIRVDGMQVLGFPMCISNDRYHRNALLFNFSVILADAADMTLWQPAVHKIASFYRTLEEEIAFLSTQETKRLVEPMLKSLYEQFMSSGTATLRATPAHTLFAAVAGAPRPRARPRRRRAAPPQRAGLHHVPVRVRDLDTLPTEEWELTLQRVLPHVDGVNHVARIAQKAGVGPRQARACVQHLVRERCVVLVDAFQYENTYAATRRLCRLAADADLQRECVWYVTLSGYDPPRCAEVFALYAALRGGGLALDLCRRIQRLRLPVDERRLVTFGLIHGLIRRVHIYPVRCPDDPATAAAAAAAAAAATAAADVGSPQGDGPPPLRFRARPGGEAASLRHSGADAGAPPAVGPDGRQEFRSVAAAVVAARAARAGRLAGPRRDLLLDAMEMAHKYEQDQLRAARAGAAAEAAADGGFDVAPLPGDALDGTRPMDALCAELMRSVSELQELVQGDPRCVLLYK